jgi:hypothetical protein
MILSYEEGRRRMSLLEALAEAGGDGDAGELECGEEGSGDGLDGGAEGASVLGVPDDVFKEGGFDKVGRVSEDAAGEDEGEGLVKDTDVFGGEQDVPGSGGGLGFEDGKGGGIGLSGGVEDKACQGGGIFDQAVVAAGERVEKCFIGMLVVMLEDQLREEGGRGEAEM